MQTLFLLLSTRSDTRVLLILHTAQLTCNSARVQVYERSLVSMVTYALCWSTTDVKRSFSTSQEWSAHTFSLQYWCTFEWTSDGNKKIINSGYTIKFFERKRNVRQFQCKARLKARPAYHRPSRGLPSFLWKWCKTVLMALCWVFWYSGAKHKIPITLLQLSFRGHLDYLNSLHFP